VSGQLHVLSALPLGKESPPCTNWIWGWLRPRAGLEDVENIIGPTATRTRILSVVQLTACRYTDCATEAPWQQQKKNKWSRRWYQNGKVQIWNLTWESSTRDIKRTAERKGRAKGSVRSRQDLAGCRDNATDTPLWAWRDAEHNKTRNNYNNKQLNAFLLLILAAVAAILLTTVLYSRNFSEFRQAVKVKSKAIPVTGLGGL
jgi:hypothetical protein